MISIGTEALFWIIVFTLVILANLINEWVHRKRRNRIVVRMYATPKADTRSSIELFQRLNSKE